MTITTIGQLPLHTAHHHNHQNQLTSTQENQPTTTKIKPTATQANLAKKINTATIEKLRRDPPQHDPRTPRHKPMTHHGMTHE